MVLYYVVASTDNVSFDPQNQYSLEFGCRMKVSDRIIRYGTPNRLDIYSRTSQPILSYQAGYPSTKSSEAIIDLTNDATIPNNAIFYVYPLGTTDAGVTWDFFVDRDRMSDIRMYVYVPSTNQTYINNMSPTIVGLGGLPVKQRFRVSWQAMVTFERFYWAQWQPGLDFRYEYDIF